MNNFKPDWQKINWINHTDSMKEYHRQFMEYLKTLCPVCHGSKRVLIIAEEHTQISAKCLKCGDY